MRGTSSSGDETTEKVRAKLLADMDVLARAISSCRMCAGGKGGLPGGGPIDADLFLLGGEPGPGATPGDPWGDWRDKAEMILSREWGWEGPVYFSTALRCSLPRAGAEHLRRCSRFLVEELCIVGPRLVLVCGKKAAVGLQYGLGDEVPPRPRAGEVLTAAGARLLFNVDFSRVCRENGVEDLFRKILRERKEIFLSGVPPEGGRSRK